MKPFEIGQEPGREHADLTAGKRDPVLGGECRADFLALAVMEKTLQSDMDNDVIADNAAGRDETGERRFPAYGHASLAASGRTHINRLPDAERSMPQGHPGAFPRFLNSHRTPAHGTGLRLFPGIYKHVGDAHCAFLTLFLEQSDHFSQGCEARERDGAVFFTS